MKHFKTTAWEVEQSSLARISEHTVTYDDCRKYACEDIVSELTHIPENIPFIMEIPENVEFHFIGRVDTESIFTNNSTIYYKTFERRKYISFSTINKRNISHYEGGVFFAYNILPEDIVHIFPMDSNTWENASNERELTTFPSLWLTLKELEKITEMLGVYNQVTCHTKRNGQIIKPIAVIAFNEITDEIRKIANSFGIGCIVIHPNKDAINYDKNLMYDRSKLSSVSLKMKELYEINVRSYLHMY